MVLPAVPVKSRATFQDVLEAPEGMVAELLDGALYLQPRPAMRHAHAGSVLGALLLPPFALGRGGPGGWWIVDEPELHISDDVLVPDLAGWRKDVLPEFDLSVAHVAQAPQWVCEVLSPSTAAKDRIRKLPKYGRLGVGHVWLIDPGARSLEVYRWDDHRWSLIGTHADEECVQAEPFEALELGLGDLWLPEPGAGSPVEAE